MSKRKTILCQNCKIHVNPFRIGSRLYCPACRKYLEAIPVKFTLPKTWWKR